MKELIFMLNLMLLIYFADDVIFASELSCRKDASRGSVRCGRAVRAPKLLHFAAACNQHHIGHKQFLFASTIHPNKRSTFQLIFPSGYFLLTTWAANGNILSGGMLAHKATRKSNKLCISSIFPSVKNI